MLEVYPLRQTWRLDIEVRLAIEVVVGLSIRLTTTPLVHGDRMGENDIQL